MVSLPFPGFRGWKVFDANLTSPPPGRTSRQRSSLNKQSRICCAPGNPGETQRVSDILHVLMVYVGGSRHHESAAGLSGTGQILKSEERTRLGQVLALRARRFSSLSFPTRSRTQSCPVRVETGAAAISQGEQSAEGPEQRGLRSLHELL